MEKNYATKFVVIFVVIIIYASIIFPKIPLYSQSRDCSPMDLAIALDNTGSLEDAIDNIKLELSIIINDAKSKLGGDLRLGYITFKDDVTVHHSLTSDLSGVEASIIATTVSGGNRVPEASNEAKNTAINNLAARPGQNGDFTTPWHGDDNGTQILILITDALPGGFDDTKDQKDITMMNDVANIALKNNISIYDVYVPTGDDFGQRAILEQDANISKGSLINTTKDGKGTSDAIKEILKEQC